MIVRQQTGLQGLVELRSGLVVEVLDGGLLDGSVHALDLAVGPGGCRLGEAMLYAVFPTHAVKAVPTGQELVRMGRELYPVVRQYGMHFVRQLIEHAPQKLSRDHALGTGVEFGAGHFAGAVDGHEKIRLAFFGVHFRKINVQIANG